MLITRGDGRLLLVDQNEHGRLAGEVCERWGNELFAAPEPLEGARRAAATHDEGWREPDALPLFNEAEGRPLQFLEVTPADHIALYRNGVETVAAQDAYAGLLVSMHWTGLYRSRWGLQTGRVDFAPPSTEIERLQQETVDAEERRWIELKRELARHARRSDLEIGAWHNYELLQAWDLISLHVCVGNLAPAPGVEPRTVSSTLDRLEQEPGPRVVPAVPLRPAGEHVDLLLEAVGDGEVAVSPYPFGETPVTLAVAATAIEDRRYGSQAEAREAIAQGEAVTISCRMRRA